jgi:FtsH-binding integral membrane protein
METNELQNIWKNIDSEFGLKSKEELSCLLKIKTKKVMNKYYYFTGLSILICVSFILFLLITAFNRSGDFIYQLNNYFVCTLTLIALISYIWTLNKLRNNKNNLPLKEWLEESIKLLSKWLSSKLDYYFVFIFAIPSILSIHVYYEYKPFIEVLKTEESIYGLSFGLIIGCLVSYFFMKKIRKYYLNNLAFLKDLYSRL